jgi:hypothetical protein
MPIHSTRLLELYRLSPETMGGHCLIGQCPLGKSSPKVESTAKKAVSTTDPWNSMAPTGSLNLRMWRLKTER